MADLLWEDVRNFFDPDLTGSLPGVRVPHASVEDWQVLLDLVNSAGWAFEYSVGDEVLPLPSADAVLSRPVGPGEQPHLRVRSVPGVTAIFRFYAAEEIDFDVDLRELQGQERLDAFCDFLSVIGRRLGKSVLMDPECDHGHPVLGFDVQAARVALLADPRFE